MLFTNIYTRIINSYLIAKDKRKTSLIHIDDYSKNDNKINIEGKIEVLGYKLLSINIKGRRR